MLAWAFARSHRPTPALAGPPQASLAPFSPAPPARLSRPPCLRAVGRPPSFTKPTSTGTAQNLILKAHQCTERPTAPARLGAGERKHDASICGNGNGRTGNAQARSRTRVRRDTGQGALAQHGAREARVRPAGLEHAPAHRRDHRRGLPGRRRHRLPQLRRARRAARSEALHGGHAGRRARKRHRGRQFQPVPHVRGGGPLLELRHAGVGAVVQAGTGQVAVPRSRIRSPLRRDRGLRHPNDPRAHDRGGTGHGRGGAPCARRRVREGHLVRAEIRQPERRHLFQRGRASPGLDALRRRGLPYLLGQRLLRASPLRRRGRTGPAARHRRRLPRGRQSAPPLQVRLHFQGDAPWRRHFRPGRQPGKRRRDQEAPGRRGPSATTKSTSCATCGS